MAAMKRTAISIEKALYDQVESLAQLLKVSRSRLFGMAVEQYVRSVEGQETVQAPAAVPQLAGEEPQFSDDHTTKASQANGGRRAIRQGDIYWVLLAQPGAPGEGIPHPSVVIQEDVLNRSRLSSVVVCALTTNLKRANLPGNVLLDPGEAGLPRQSVVEVTKVNAIEKTRLGTYIGSVSRGRVGQILAGLEFVEFFTEPHEDVGETT